MGYAVLGSFWVDRMIFRPNIVKYPEPEPELMKYQFKRKIDWK